MLTLSPKRLRRSFTHAKVAKGAKGFQMWEWGESRVCGTRLGVLSCECEIYFMKSGIDRHEVRSESGTVVFLEFGESSE